MLVRVPNIVILGVEGEGRRCAIHALGSCPTSKDPHGQNSGLTECPDQVNHHTIIGKTTNTTQADLEQHFTELCSEQNPNFHEADTSQNQTCLSAMRTLVHFGPSGHFAGLPFPPDENT